PREKRAARKRKGNIGAMRHGHLSGQLEQKPPSTANGRSYRTAGQPAFPTSSCVPGRMSYAPEYILAHRISSAAYFGTGLSGVDSSSDTYPRYPAFARMPNSFAQSAGSRCPSGVDICGLTWVDEAYGAQISHSL